MDEEGGHGSFLWDYPFSNNSDNSGGSEEKSPMNKLPDSSSNSPTPTTRTVTARTGSEKPRKRSVISKNGKGSSEGNECKDGGGGESEHEIHIWTERERRKKMRNMFSSLHALLPQLPPKADKSTIVDEAVNYIRTLQHSFQKLQKQRLEMLRGGSTIINYEPSVVTAQPSPALHSAREAFIADQQGVSQNLAITTTNSHQSLLLLPHFPASCFQTWCSPNVVLSVCGNDAQISVCSPTKPRLLVTIFYVLEKHNLEVISAHISSDYYRSMCMIHAHASGISDQFPDALPVEAMYKNAVGEMIIWLSSC